MFFEQVIVPVLIIAMVCFWAGMRFETTRQEVREKQKKRPVVRQLPKRFNWKV